MQPDRFSGMTSFLALTTDIVVVGSLAGGGQRAFLWSL
jgi:hypothetical protein